MVLLDINLIFTTDSNWCDNMGAKILNEAELGENVEPNDQKSRKEEIAEKKFRLDSSKLHHGSWEFS